ncbi:ABC transporter ATP-binding protein [Alkalihalobacterium chitinilyticum]|uniref:ABC transporter ATP-binding protein/permease n=1 Tax=Alkalihalobacterium chitinilyticum TaxID=2980103 RepID=A0ABT5VFT4_9BACI|nr:ABC transporter ATP-binding protein [Alkalihalobacterium chitinilyticum]MDE5413577.1 ABC transporter ATP-binding protein/permease [Alkalihalobacterium chitinilyticum]
MNTFKRLKEFYWPYKKFFISSMLFLIVVTAITVIYPIILKITIDDVILAGNSSLVPYIAFGFILLMVFKGFATYYHQFLGDLFGVRAVYELRNALYKKLQYLPFRYYDNAKTGDLMSRLTADVEGFRFFLSFGFAQLLNLVLIVSFSFSIMLYFSVPLALVTLASMPFLILTVYKFDKKVHPAFKHIRKSFGRLTTKVQENISGMNTVKSLSREDFEIDNFVDKNSDYKNKSIDTSNIWAKYFPIMELIGQLCVVFLLGYGGWLVIQGALQPGELVAFFSLVWYIIGPLMNLGFIINTFSQSKASGERLLEVLNEPEDIRDAEQPLETPIKGHVQFKNVSHQYNSEEELALHNVSFEAPTGKIIGLIGATGSGKTSLTQLISRFYEPNEGEILIDGRDIKEYSLKTLRHHIGVVLQESFLFSSSIRDNIAYGNPEATLEQIIEAAKRAQAHDFIMELPDGYDTVLGERGMGLSGGQKQRIAIARSILIDPSILILDDATSAVDMKTEGKIQAAFREVMTGRTTFIIAHRISSLRHADEILVLDNGKVVERGTHEQLIANESGAYRRIYNIQYQDQHAFQQRQLGVSS